jgi:hypothetical protein
MAYSHKGLSEIAKKNKIDVKNLSESEFVVFINKRLNAVKIYAPNNIIAYLRSPDGKRLEMKTIQMIPYYFRGGQFQYDKALERVLLRAI